MAEISKRDSYIILAIVTFGNFISPFMVSSVNIALPSIAGEFNLDSLSLNWIPTAFMLASAIFLVPFGRISDIYGRKKVYFFGSLFFGFTTFLCAISTNYPLLMIARIGQGIGGGMFVGIGPALLTSVFPQEKRGRVLGIATAAVYIGSSSGPLVGGMLVESYGWRSIFWAALPLFAISASAIAIFIRGEWSAAAGEKFDFLGSVLYMLGMVAFILGMSEILNPLYIVLSAAGILVLIAFIKWEMKIEFPVLDTNLFKNNRMFVFSNIAALTSYSATSAVSMLLSLYLQYNKGMSPFYSGLILFVQPLTQAIFSPIAGRLSDKIPPGNVASFGMAMTCLGLVLLNVESFISQMWLIYVSLFVLGFGFAMFSAPNVNAIMSSVDKKRLGIASSITATMRNVGQTFSLAIVMLVFSVIIGKAEITFEVYDKFLISMRIALLIMAILCFAGTFASVARDDKAANIS